MNLLCITNRKLSERPFLEQIEYVASKHPFGIVLREKDLSLEEYLSLSKDVLRICHSKNVPLFLHGIDKAEPEKITDFILKNNEESDMKFAGIHLSMGDFQKILKKYGSFNTILNKLKIIVSTHSLGEALFCEKNGASYITASHIFQTDCKKGLAPKGLPFLEEICKNVKLPVFALGGINKSNAKSCLESGAFGVSVMSECMKKDFLIQKN